MKKFELREEDMRMIEEMAVSYDMTVPEFIKEISKLNRSKKERQFRVNQEEYDLIANKAKAQGMTISKFCQFACKKFLADPDLERCFENCRSYSEIRTKRLAVRFADESLEEELLAMSENLSIEIGTLIRYCSLIC